MSTKIFNGYYIDSCTLQELQAFSMSLRSQIKTKVEELYAKKLLSLSTYYFDKKFICNSPPLKYCPLITAKWRIDDRFYNIEKTNTRDPEYDFGFDITFIPTPTKILMLVYTEQRDLISILKSFPNVHSYPYYNNIDRPATISESDWELRGEEWDKALSPYDIPSLQGLSIKCLVYTPFLNKEELLLYVHFIPSFEQRINHFAKIKNAELFQSRHVRHYNSQPKVHEYMDWIDSKIGIEKLKQLSFKISKQLQPIVTLDDLLKD